MTARLPPYSTFRTDKTQVMVPQAVSHGNILTFTPRGFKQTINVKFPDSRLAVCEKCKKNYKTRDSCRVRSGHTTVPWTTAYICITLDDSCTDAAGNYVDSPLTVRMISWQPFCMKDEFDSKTPVCAACKKTNRTRSFCRARHKHRQMPWCTVFVILSTVDSTDPSTVVASPSVPADLSNPYSNMPGFSKPSDNYDQCNTDDINKIEESRTFLAKISSKHSSIHWLKYNNMEGNNSGASESDVKALNDAIRTPGAGAPPIVLDANQQYYQMTQQAMQHQVYNMQQPFNNWTYPQTMMPMPVIQQIRTNDSPTQGLEPQRLIEGARNGEEQAEAGLGKDDAKCLKSEESSQDTASILQQQQQHQAWQTQQMIYHNQQQIYHNQMYAQHQQHQQQSQQQQSQQQLSSTKQMQHDNGEQFMQHHANINNDVKQDYSQHSYTGPLLLPLSAAQLQDPSQRSAYSNMQGGIINQPQDEESYQAMQEAISGIAEPEMKIPDEDFAESISPNIFNTSFPSHSEIPKRGRDMENSHVHKEMEPGGESESQKRPRIDDHNYHSV